MRAGEPIQFSQFLPSWMKAEDVYILLISITITMCVVAYTGFTKKGGMAGKIKHIQQRRDILRDEALGAKKRNRPETSINFMRSVVLKLQLIKKNQIDQTETKLMEGGFRSKDAIYVLTFFNLVTPIVLGILGFIVMKLNSDVSEKWRMFNYIWPVLGAYIGLKLPGIYVGRKRKKRLANIRKSLPDMLDLMTICAEAGLSLSATLDRVARELMLAYPDMAEELSMTSVEMGFLPDRNKALSNLSERCHLQEVRGIVSVLIQTEKYGTPIAQALRVLSAEFRQARMMRAEQKAARLPALMTVPMIIFILPTLFIVIIAPAAVKLLNTLNSQ